MSKHILDLGFKYIGNWKMRATWLTNRGPTKNPTSNPSKIQISGLNLGKGKPSGGWQLGLYPKDPFVCPKKGIISTILFWGWDVSTINPTKFREGNLDS